MDYIWMPLLGGVLIGVASTMMLGGLGRITGISGIVTATLSKPKSEHFWRYSFLLGLIFGGIGMQFFYPQFFNYQIEMNYLKVALAGLLVGVGTNLGNGCTSGHGVCGVARLSKRSIVATITFIIFGILTVLIDGVVK